MPQHHHPATVVQVAARHGIDVRGESLTRHSSGLDFEVAIAPDGNGTDWVLRFPRRSDVQPRVIQEQRALSLIHEFVSFETPRWQVCELDLIAYKSLNGTPAGTFTTQRQDYLWGTGPVPEQFTTSLARALVELHQVPARRAAAAGLPIAEPGDLRQVIADRMHQVRAEFGVGERLWGRWHRWIDHDQGWPSTTGLTHGDLHPGHILVDSDTVVTGILDWTEAKVADISHDFVFHYLAFGDAELRALIDRYQEAGGATWPLMKEHVAELAAAFPIQIAEFAMATGSAEMTKLAGQLLGIAPAK